MMLLAGSQAIGAVRRMLPQFPLVVATNAAARAGGRLEILAFGNTQQQLLVDVAQTPQLTTLWPAVRRLCAFEAKTVQQILLRTWGAQALVRSWGCIYLSELLLLAGVPAAGEFVAIAQRYGLAAPADGEGGFAAMAAHVQALAQVVLAQTAQLQARHLQRVSRLEAQCVAPIASMEAHGMPFETACWQQLTRQTEQEHSALQRQIGARLQQHGTLSTAQAAALWQQEAHLLAALRQHGLPLHNLQGRSLAQLPAPWSSWLPRWRTTHKLLHSYGRNFLSYVHADGRLRATFTQIGAHTGRLACHTPNLQAMVKSSAHRRCFRPAATRCLIMADYNACELRILAELSQEAAFLDAFAQGADVHAQVASLLFQCQVTTTQHAELRKIAKVVSFGLAYGMGPQALSGILKLDRTEAQALLHRYQATFPRLTAYLRDSATAALAQGFAQSLSGRQLNLQAPAYQQDAALARRVAKNMPIQGSNADMLKIALTLLQQRWRQHPDTQVVNCIHDEIVVECPRAVATQRAAELRQVMLQAGAQLLRHVGMAVDVQIQPHWL